MTPRGGVGNIGHGDNRRSKGGGNSAGSYEAYPRYEAESGIKAEGKGCFPYSAQQRRDRKVILENSGRLKEDFSLSDVIMKKDDDMKVVVETKVSDTQIWAGIR
jgi:hypothetical protein